MDHHIGGKSLTKLASISWVTCSLLQGAAVLALDSAACSSHAARVCCHPIACAPVRLFVGADACAATCTGMHASISAHIANDYLLDEAAGEWGPSLAQFRQRLGGPAAADRVANMYFTYLFVLRAVLKAGPTLQAVAYDTGAPAQDRGTAKLVQQLVRSCWSGALQLLGLG